MIQNTKIILIILLALIIAGVVSLLVSKKRKCIPDCSNGKKTDGCGGICPFCTTCPSGQNCIKGHCVSPCIPNCGGNRCGSDGCGGECPSCKPGSRCMWQGGSLYLCCDPWCKGKTTGQPDGCGRSCP